MMTRDEHLEWAKKRALEYFDKGDYDQALTSMGSDLTKHPELVAIEKKMFPVGFMYLINHNFKHLRQWIEGFR